MADLDRYDDLPDNSLPSGLAGEPPPEALPIVPGDVPRATAEPDEDAWPPPVPAEAPGNVGAPAPLVAPATPVTAPTKAGDSEATIAAQAELDRKKAETEADIAQKEADIARERDEDERIANAAYLEQRAAHEADVEARLKEYQAAKFVDPRSRDIGRARLAVIFGGLGAAQSAAGGGDSRNRGLDAVLARWEQDNALQRANIDKLHDNAAMSRTRLTDFDAARTRMKNDANARYIARLDAAEKQGRKQLKDLGIPQAGIDADERIQKLRLARAAAVKQAEKDADDHALKQARIKLMEAQAARAARKAAGAGGGGAGSAAAATLAKQIQERIDAGNPMNPAEEIDAAAKLGIPVTAKPGRPSLHTIREGFNRDEKNARGELVLSEKDEARTLRDPNTGDPLGMAPNARVVAKMGEDLGFLAAYQDKAEEFAAHLEKYGHLVNPLSREYKERQSIGADLQAIGRKVKGIQASDAGQKLEHMVIGGTGTGLERSADPTQVRKLAEDARVQVERRLRSTLEPMPGQKSSRAPSRATEGGEAPAPAKAAPSGDELLAEAKKVIASPSQYSPKAVQRAAAYLKSRTSGR